MKISSNPKMQVVDKAVSFYDKMKEACSQPDKAITGEMLEIYNELRDWGFVEKYSILDKDNRWLYVVIIAMLLHKEEKAVESTDVYIAKDKGAKWQIIQNALEKNKK